MGAEFIGRFSATLDELIALLGGDGPAVDE
jgi:hypothetical protein